MDKILFEQLPELFESVAAVFADKRDELCDMDAKMGDGDLGLTAVIHAAVEGATEGVEATKNMTPKFGKAAVFAAKAIGTPDQGAVAGRYMIVGLQNYICK